jgi:hypothetical protein
MKCWRHIWQHGKRTWRRSKVSFTPFRSFSSSNFPALFKIFEFLKGHLYSEHTEVLTSNLVTLKKNLSSFISLSMELSRRFLKNSNLLTVNLFSDADVKFGNTEKELVFFYFLHGTFPPFLKNSNLLTVNLCSEHGSADVKFGNIEKELGGDRERGPGFPRR